MTAVAVRKNWLSMKAAVMLPTRSTVAVRAGAGDNVSDVFFMLLDAAGSYRGVAWRRVEVLNDDHHVPLYGVPAVCEAYTCVIWGMRPLAGTAG